MKMIIAAAVALACTSCGANSPFERVTFSVGYGEAAVSADLYLKDPKNPIARRRHSGK